MTRREQLQEWMSDEEIDDATQDQFDEVFAETKRLREENEALRAALRRIVIGRTVEDIGHPLGHWASMAGRFIEIAKEALAPGRRP